MNIVVFQENLIKQLSLASHFLPTKTSTIQVLNNFLIEAKNGKIVVTASNIETTISLQVSGKIEEEGKALLPAKTILSLLPTLTGEKVSIQLNKKKLIIKGERTEATLSTEQPEDFPVLTEKKEKKTISLKKETILEIYEKISFASSSDPSRAILTSILVHGEGKRFVVVATDGFRLAKIEKETGSVTDFPKTLFPGKVFESLASILKEADIKEVPVSFFGEGNQTLFSLKTTTLFTQTVAGSFPDYNRIIPSSHTTKTTLSREEFLRGVKFASVLARESSNIIRFSIKKNEMVITANAPQTGENKITIPVEKEGEDVDAAFNYRFILDFLSASSEKDVVFETEGPLSPGVFRFLKSPDYLYIVMPVRLQESQ